MASNSADGRSKHGDGQSERSDRDGEAGSTSAVPLPSTNPRTESTDPTPPAVDPTPAAVDPAPPAVDPRQAAVDPSPPTGAVAWQAPDLGVGSPSPTSMPTTQPAPGVVAPPVAWSGALAVHQAGYQPLPPPAFQPPGTPPAFQSPGTPPAFQPATYPPGGTPPGYAGPALAPVPRPAPGSSRTGRLVTVVGVIAALIWFGCGVGFTVLATAGGGDRDRAVAVDGDADTPVLEESDLLVAVRMGDGADLLAHILPVPAGGRSLDVAGATGGIFTIGQYATKQRPRDTEAVGRLRYREYAVAAERDWVDAGQTEVRIQLVQFRSIWGAQGYFDTDRSSEEQDRARTGWYLVSTGEGSGSAVERSDSEGRGLHQTVVTAFYRNILIKVYATTAGAYDRPAVTALLTTQVNRLRT